MTSELITFQNYIDYISNPKFKRIKKFIYVKDIKYTLDYYKILPKKLQKSKKKNELFEILFDFYKNIQYYKKNEKKIILIQNQIRKYLQKNNVYGPGLTEKSNNDCDFYTFVPIKDIPKEYLFSYKDEKNFVYSFDIRSFEKLLKSKSQNPYNRQDIPISAINLYKKRMDYIKKNKINVQPFEEDKLTPEQIYKNRVFKIFQTIDLLNTMAGGTNQQWFFNLSILELKAYYKVLEDIWNYRAELTPSQKYEIVKNKKMFPKRVNEVYLLNDEKKIREIILDEIEKLLFTSDSDIHKATASYYILIAFVEISSECAQAMPWLIQY